MRFKRKYIPVDEVANFLGKTEEEVIQLIEEKEVVGIKDEADEWICPVYYSKGIRFVHRKRDFPNK